MILKIGKYILKAILIIFVLLVIFFAYINLTIKPSTEKNWNNDQKILPYAEIKDNLVTIHNIRNFKYASTTSYTERYYDKTFDLNKIKNVWFVVEPFSGLPGSAHTLLSFEFEENNFVAISVEIRKEKGETYNPLKGLLNQYELMYVIADENDVVKLRSNYRKDQVYVYPAKTSKEKVRALFLSMINRANDLRDNPEFYNTITNTCTTNIVAHINEITPKRVPLMNLRILLPANSDKLAYELGLLDIDPAIDFISFEEIRKIYNINEKALKYADSKDFSAKIREEVTDKSN